jgi:hypothetical protein
MKKELKLKTPLLVDGKKVETMFYDFDNFDEALLDRAEKLELERSNGIHPVMENNYAYHKIIAKLAIEAATPGVSYEDLSRLKGLDLFVLSKVGRDFLFELDSAAANSSDAESVPTAESSEEASEPCETPRSSRPSATSEKQASS